MRISNKDILIGYIQTLSDKECKDIYYTINDMKIPKKDMVNFDLVRISKSQYSKLLWIWGEDKFNKCVDILNEWLHKKELTKPVSHYRLLIGWVDNVYSQKYGIKDKSIKFNSDIDTIAKAKRYIKSIPEELRSYDSEVKFLVEKFGTEILFA